MSVGQNTVSGEQLRSYVDRIERLRVDKKQIADDEKQICAEAQASGFSPKAIRECVRIRAMKPHDRQEEEAMLDMYLHALGMSSEPPLFRAAGLAGIDTTAREQIVERMKDFVPANGLGEITVTWGGKAVRLVRGKDGTVSEQEIVEKAKPEPRGEAWASTKEKPPVPDVTPDGAVSLGKQYAQDNRPVIDNPFPFGDPRRPLFDRGWRTENGGDGMGPDRED